MSPAIATEVSSAIRDLSAGVETQRRAFGSIVASALRLSASLLGPGVRTDDPQAGPVDDVVIVDRYLTRC